MNSASDDLRREAYTTPRPDVFELVPPTAMRILDAGCSNGALGESLRRASSGRSICGIEFDQRLATEARQRLDRVIQADLNQFDWSTSFSSERFDCIIFADVLEHLVDPWAVLQASTGFLAFGGSIIVSLPNVRHISSLWSIFVRGTFPRRTRGIFDGTHLRWFTIGDAMDMVAAVGCKVAATDYSLRLRDTGGGYLNKAVIRVFGPIRHVYPVREFLAYQFCLRVEIRRLPGTAGS